MIHNDFDFEQAVEAISNEIDSRRGWGERIREWGRTLRLLAEILWTRYLVLHRRGGTR